MADEQPEQPRQALAIGIQQHPITGQLGLSLQVTNGDKETAVFLGPEEAMQAASRITAQATVALVMQAQAALAQQAQTPAIHLPGR